jgi:hypothetical protein
MSFRKLIPAREALESSEWLGGIVGADSFKPMRTLAIAALGEALTAAELELYRQLTGGRSEAPASPVSELWVLAGRRSGKTVMTGALASYLAGCIDWGGCFNQGERGTLPVMASTMVQARSLMNICKGVFTGNSRFAPLVRSITGDTIALRNRVDIQIRPASHRSIRGLTAISAIAEEISIWQDDERGSQNPDKAILAAVRPSLATTGGMLFSLGSPYGKTGEAWKMFKRHYGAQGAADIIVANGPTKLFNPSIPQSVIDRAYEEDPLEAASEWGGEFRVGRDAFVPVEAVEACVERGVFQRQWERGRVYMAHVDVSGGGDDSFAVAIGHAENGTYSTALLSAVRRYPRKARLPISAIL